MISTLGNAITSRAIYLISGILLVVMCGADKPTSLSDNSAIGTSAVVVKFTSNSGTPFSRLAKRAVLVISANDMTSLSKPLVVTDTSIEGAIENIPSGSNRLFIVSVYDTLDSLVYYGTANANLPRGATVMLPLNLYRIGTQTHIGVSINDNATIVNMIDIAQWKTLSGTAINKSGKLIIGNDSASTTRIESIGILRPPCTVTWYGSFPSTALSTHTFTLATTEDSNFCSFWTRRQDPGRFGFSVAIGGKTEDVVIPLIIANGTEIEGEFEIAVSNDSVSFYVDRAVVARRGFPVRGKMRASFTSFGRAFLVGAISVVQK